jgi:hypothetical protein
MALRPTRGLQSNGNLFQVVDARQPVCNVDMPWSYSGVDELSRDRDSATAGLECRNWVCMGSIGI